MPFRDTFGAQLHRKHHEKLSFYNKATIEDVRDTIKAGCSYGPERGILLVYEAVILLWFLPQSQILVLVSPR